MKTNTRDTLLRNLSDIYPEHEWIDLDNYPHEIDNNTTPIDLNLQCLKIIKEWIEETLGLPSAYEFPYVGSPDNDNFVSELLNGFCLKVNGSKIIFIPSQNLDITACEIPQEWVDLPSWKGDYYVPIQIDVEAKYLHLWGIISDRQLKQIARLDPLFRYYHLDGERMTANLDVLWASCELAPVAKNAIASLPPLTQTQAQQTIDQIISKPSPNFPRLILPFSQWGAILNHRDYLSQYLKTSAPRSIVTNLSNWLDRQLDSFDRHWETLEHFINLPQPQMAVRSSRNHLRQVINQKGIPLETEAQITPAIAQLYRSQTDILTPDKITGVEDLVILMENSTDDNIRWKATEYLWVINPHHPKLPIRRIRDLGIQFATDSLALMISQLPITNHRRAILLRVYPVSEELYLPAGVKLSILDENGEPILLSAAKPFEAISRAEPQDSYIQLYFVADARDRFSTRVNLGTQQFTEHFIV